MCDFTVCEQQNLANSLFVETPELEKYLIKLVPWRRGGGRPPPKSAPGHYKKSPRMMQWHRNDLKSVRGGLEWEPYHANDAGPRKRAEKVGVNLDFLRRGGGT